jgi:2-dehydro-3-deoxyphosphogluconate aldolase/(4S)-4-hydroxy-2-oxoglutarate aldolase
MEGFFTKRILPAVTFEDSNKALKVAKAILDGGLDVMEVPFRTGEACGAIRKIRAELADMHVGAGTILNVHQLHEAQQSGAQFGLAPGFNPSVVKEAIKIDFPFIPGVMTPSEVELALELGCKILKLFPAAQVGGLEMLKALEGPYAHTGVKFIPMGGVNIQNLKQFIAQKSVIAVGGSWLATQLLIANDDYKKITSNVAEALALAFN